MPEKIVQSGVIPTGISDHILIYGIRKINPVLSTRKKAKKVEVRNMKRFNSFAPDVRAFSKSFCLLHQIFCKRNIRFPWEIYCSKA